MRKLTRRKFLIQVIRRDHQDNHLQKDLVNLIKEKGRTLEIKATQGKYYLPVVEEMIVTAAVMKKNQIEESRSILNPVKKLKCQQVITPMSRPKIEKGW